VADDDNRVDVAKVMREIRDEIRSRRSEIDRRLERASARLAAHFPEGADEQIRHCVERLNALFDRYYKYVAQYLGDQEPNYANIRYTISEINRLLAEKTPPRGPRDEWWNPRFWVKRALLPVRRFILRRQEDLNSLMRDTLVYLVNHSAHVEAKRLELEIGVELVHAVRAFAQQALAMRRALQKWPAELQRPVFDYLGDVLEEFSEKKSEEINRVLREERDFVQAAMDRLIEETGAKLARIERRLAGEKPAASPDLVGFDNLRFAEAMRGEEETIREQLERYVAHFQGCGPVLDAGCGRGEMLELLRARGIEAYGVDSDEEMVNHCRAKGFDARCEDVLDHLAALPDGALGGLVAIQLIEHFDFPRLAQFFRLAGAKVRGSGVALFETVNPACLTVFSGAFFADPTHQNPIHPEAARRLMELAGFDDVKIEFVHPVSEDDKLKPLPLEGIEDPSLRRAVEALNANIERLNSLLYGFADYAVVGRKTGGRK